jgi:protein-disulfide isomerase
MDEPTIAKSGTEQQSDTKWIVLIVGGGCALLACVILIIALAVALFFPVTGRVFSEINEELDGPQPSGDNLIPESETYPFADANTLGDPDAPVIIIIYSDFQCIYCMNYWEETEPQIIENYVATGKVYYEYRSFGDFLGPASATAAEAAYCASDQDKFWEYHDLIFQNWAGEGSGDFSPNRLRDYADTLGLDVNDFSDCLEKGAYKSQVEQDVSNAQADGISATPSFLINGKLVEGAQPFSLFESEIEAALGEN